jgi:hypothetical protein
LACRGIVPTGRALCLAHDPARRDEVAEARRRGGKLKALNGKRRRLDNQQALAQFITGLVYDVVEGRQDPDVARCALYGASILRQLAEHGIEKRLAEVERLLAQRRMG